MKTFKVNVDYHQRIAQFFPYLKINQPALFANDPEGLYKKEIKFHRELFLNKIDMRLVAAALAGKYEVFSTIVDQNTKKLFGIIALSNGHINFMQYLDDNGIATAFLYATIKGYLPIVQILWKLKIQEKKADFLEIISTAFQYTAENGHIGVIKYLLSEDEDIFQQTSKVTFIATASEGHLEIMLLLKKYVTPSIYGAALKNAAFFGQVTIVEYLLKECDEYLTIKQKNQALEKSKKAPWLNIASILSKNIEQAQKLLPSSPTYTPQMHTALPIIDLTSDKNTTEKISQCLYR